VVRMPSRGSAASLCNLESRERGVEENGIVGERGRPLGQESAPCDGAEHEAHAAGKRLAGGLR